MYLVPSTSGNDPDQKDPIVMRRRALIAAAIGTASAALPPWATPAAATPDRDNTLIHGSFNDAYSRAYQELADLGARYVTRAGATDRDNIADSGLWLFAQTDALAKKAPTKHQRSMNRLAAQAAMFTAGCHIDLGNARAAVDLYSRAHHLCGEKDLDLRAFISTQANWVPMYHQGGAWNTVLKRSQHAATEAEEHGGYARLMAWTHAAAAQAELGDKAAARESLKLARANVARVSGANGPNTALTYNATKVAFSACSTYADLGDTAQFNEAAAAAKADPRLGWVDRNLLDIVAAQLDPDPEHAAHGLRLRLAAMSPTDLNACIRTEAGRVLGKLKAREITRNHRIGTEVRMLGHFLSTVRVA